MPSVLLSAMGQCWVRGQGGEQGMQHRLTFGRYGHR